MVCSHMNVKSSVTEKICACLIEPPWINKYCNKLKQCKHLGGSRSLSVTVVLPAPACCHVSYTILTARADGCTRPNQYILPWTAWTEYVRGVSVGLFWKCFTSDKLFSLQKLGSWGPKRLVRVAFYVFFKSFYSWWELQCAARWQHVQYDEGFPSSQPLPYKPLAVVFHEGFIYIISSPLCIFTWSHTIVTLLPVLFRL